MIDIDEIDELAEKVLRKYSDNLPVDPFTIAEKVGIKVIPESFDNHFKGSIRYQNRKFYIFLNTDILGNIKWRKSRYTLSHELGHYFIKKHRDRIKQGEYLAFTGRKVNDPTKKIVEEEAEQFAASLLMPKTEITHCVNQLENLGFEGILNLKDHFDVSISSAGIRFNKLNLTACITVVWDKNKIRGYGVSQKFSDLLSNKYTIIIKLNPDRAIIDQEDVYYEPNDLTYTRSYTLLSSWVHSYSVPVEITNEFLVIEETHFGKYGNFTLIRPLYN